MAIKAPFNITILNPDEYIQMRNCLLVTSHSIYEASSVRFHPEGLFSEVIFGQVGSRDRLVRRGYLDLRTRIFSPHLYKQLISLKGFYQDVLAGRVYAYYDPEIKDLVKTTRDDMKGETGYSFFVRILPKIVFPETESNKRHEKIALLKKYQDLLLMTRFIVLPAGVRDIKEQDSRLQIEKINKMYLSLLSLAQAMPEGLTEDPTYDALRFQIQMKVQMVYDYIINLLEGKGGFLQSKYAARNVVYSNRNVITAAPMTRAYSPDAPNNFMPDEALIPLYQTMKGSVPLIINKLKTIFFDPIFVSQTSAVPLVNPENNHLEYSELSPKELRKWTTSDGVEDIINAFRDPATHFKPVTVTTDKGDEKYLYLVYDMWDTIYTFRDIDDFKHAFEKTDTFTTQYASNLSKLEGWDPNSFVIMGSTALTVFGMTHYNQDLDLIVAPAVFDQIKQDPRFKKLPYGAYRSDELGMDIYNEVPGILTQAFGFDMNITFDELKDKYSIKVDGYNFVDPEHMQYIYKHSDRPKDKEKLDFLRTIVFDWSLVRPLTMVEMCYIATYSAMKNCRCTITRHPVINLQGLQVFKPHLISTNVGRMVTLKTLGSGEGVIHPEYPDMDYPVKTTLSPHPCTLAQFNGDFDGCSSL